MKHKKQRVEKEEEIAWPVFMFKDWSFFCDKKGEVITIYKEFNNETRRILIDDSTGECIISID